LTLEASPAMSSKRRDITSLGYRRIVQLLVYLVIVPGVLLSAVGVLLLVLNKSSYNLLIGILVLTFTGTLVTGVILVWVFLRRERDLSQLQADFVSKVSHELRTPLTSIRMFTETLTLRRGDKTAEDRCIEASTRRAPACSSSSIVCSTGAAWRAGGASTRSASKRCRRWWTRP
jgi:two-component system phosphate regulon sensor histidine kinase PhoR